MIFKKAVFIVILFFFVITAETARSREWTLSLYGGRMTDEHWEEVIQPHVEYRDGYLIAAAVSRTAKRFFDQALSLETEIQVVKYFGGQANWEFNLPILALRWNRFPWDKRVATTFAWGIGPSYATEIPKVEKKIDSGSAQWLVYWFGELTFGPPRGQWALLLRLHHRSEAFGLVAERGGSNTICGGLKLQF